MNLTSLRQVVAKWIFTRFENRNLNWMMKEGLPGNGIIDETLAMFDEKIKNSLGLRCRILKTGVTVHFPGNNDFFFGNCASYKAINRDSVREMDICWMDNTAYVLWCVELKAFDHPENINRLDDNFLPVKSNTTSLLIST